MYSTSNTRDSVHAPVTQIAARIVCCTRNCLYAADSGRCTDCLQYKVLFARHWFRSPYGMFLQYKELFARHWHKSLYGLCAVQGIVCTPLAQVAVRTVCSSKNCLHVTDMSLYGLCAYKVLFARHWLRSPYGMFLQYKELFARHWHKSLYGLCVVQGIVCTPLAQVAVRTVCSTRYCLHVTDS